jgi:hypothetical protein
VEAGRFAIRIHSKPLVRPFAPEFRLALRVVLMLIYIKPSGAEPITPPAPDRLRRA